LAAMTDDRIPDKFENPNHIPEPYLMAIGQVCVNWGALEEIVDLVIGKLAHFDISDQRAVAVTAHMSWPQKMDVLETLVDILRAENPHLAKFDDAKPLLKKAQEGRNRVVHGQWSERDGKIYKLRVSARRKLKFGFVPIAIEDIHAIAFDIGQAGLVTLKMILDD